MPERFRVMSLDDATKAGIYEKSRWDDDYQTFLFDFKDPDKPILIASDRMEPEDACFWRDLAWVPKLLNEVANGR